ncbi:chromosome segregation protein SMC [Paenisporosarcina cavernae]|uniref:Chromosome partition protein Smc n=1 Tax=Paenisporosarcina cavernae TaxID=2320858 RepID=A0A385YRU0_9BACL|nr:chromosome segregation protein SMC [Paenisporosarcina cavernae]AYC29214.1 chromosome segregation protein SMC [Paenisporosarcina cavernae]
MFLKRLEVIGFKSFADRIGIDFVPGVTAVVGPNGSGKSNVTDAIRWVLGEQSAKSLRGAKMEDVIFAGSDSRKPLNFAEVTLVLDNSDQRIPLDFHEISVTRRVFRSGDSEYQINKQSCRLKDITDLFMDSGLGKEAFSIISQGRVDEILNSKAEDRRSIFEEAAGVLKYKLRKKKAESKLFETDDNLNRVLDILHELEGRMEPLREQASKAKDYVEMTTSLKDIELNVLAYDWKAMEEKSQELATTMSQLTKEKENLQQSIASLEESLTKQRLELGQQDTRLDEAQEVLVEASSELERWEGRKLLFQEKNTNAATQIAKLEEEKRALEKEMDSIQSEISSLGQRKTEKETQLKEAKISSKQLEHQMVKSSAEIEEELEEWKSKYIDRLNEEATLKNEVKNILQLLSSEEAHQSKVSGESSQVQHDLSELHQNRQQVERSLKSIREELSGKRGAYSKSSTELEEWKQTLESKQSILYKAYQHAQQLKARKESLENLEAEFSGFFQGVKEVLQAREKGQLNGIIGAVAELISVDAAYSKAIETSLGGALQHVVTKTDQDARQAIQLLKQKRMGRATFLPLSVMKARKLSGDVISSIKGHPAFVDTADRLVESQAENRVIIENLLGNVIVAKDLEGASKLAKVLQHRYRIVSLDGDIVNAGGSLTGGASKQQSSVFTRKAELEQLISQVQELEHQLEQAEKQVASWKEKVSQRSVKLDEEKQQGEELRSKEMELELSLRQIDEQVKRLQDRFTITESEKEHMVDRQKSLEVRQIEAQNRLEKVAIELTQMNEQIDRLTKLKNQGQQERDRLTELSAEMRSQIAVLSEQVLTMEKTYTSERNRLQSVQDKVIQVDKEIRWIATGEGNSGPSEEEIEKALLTWMEKKQQSSEIVLASKEARQRIQGMIIEIEQALKVENGKLQYQLDTIRKLDVQINRLDVEQQALIEHLDETYHMDETELQLPDSESYDLADARKKLKLLKQSIEELGSVNVGAIEEFEKVSERFAFLTEQRQDLVDAKETLHEAIKEMDQEMTSRFHDAFFAIRAQFTKVFRELFGGGNADLILTNPEDLLGTGIEIVAQPPGKKLQALSLLSGGERALTAIALLFAILNIRPVPFCILDEVEAALDESNVVRYSQYLKKFSQDTQFIVITHRKGTMEGADVLYGITMQESGISKLVSVKLEEEERELVTQGSAKN